MAACLQCLSSLFSSFSSGGEVLYVKGKELKVKKQIGEGGYSFVYLVEDTSTGEPYALKKILCQAPEQQTEAEWEIKVWKDIRHQNIIPLIDYSIVPARQAGAKVVLLLLPYCRRGSLQTELERRQAEKDPYSESEILNLFIPICEAVRVFHNHNPPWAHRDLKPGNILIADSGKPMLMDFGSVGEAVVNVQGRQDAIRVQEEAERKTTAAYRPPELCDVQSSGVIDERVDVWMLGCLLYAMAYFRNPWDAEVCDNGGSLTLAIMNSDVKFPKDDRYSEVFHNVIRWMLTKDASERPTLSEVLSKLRTLSLSGSNNRYVSLDDVAGTLSD